MREAMRGAYSSLTLNIKSAIITIDSTFTDEITDVLGGVTPQHPTTSYAPGFIGQAYLHGLRSLTLFRLAVFARRNITISFVGS